MEREVKFSLVFRDMWQSAGKYVPRVDQLVKVAPAIIEMGCFARVETNGGGFEQVNLLFGENPNKAVREWTAHFNDGRSYLYELVYTRYVFSGRLPHISENQTKLYFSFHVFQ